MLDVTAGGSFTEIDATIVQNRPSLTSYNVTGLLHTGGFYQFKIVVSNSIGNATSKAISL